MPAERSATASDLALVALLNYKAAEVKFLPNTTVERIDPATSTIYIDTSKYSKGPLRSIRAQKVGVAIGLTDPTVGWEPRLKDYFAQTKNFPLLKNGVYHQRDFLRIFHQQLSVSTPYVAKQVEGKNIVVIGNQHGAFISIEPFVGVLPDLHQKPIPRTARSVTVLGLPARNKHEFLEYVRPGGAEVDASKASLFQERYTRYGLADAIGNFVRTIPDRATKVDWNLANPADKPIVTYRNAEGLVQRIQADIVIVSTGYDSRMQMEKLFGNPPQGLFYPIDLGGEIQMQPITVQTGETNFVYGQGTVERYTEVAYKVRTRQPDNVDRIFVYGAGAGLRPTLQELNASITGSPDSINILAPKTEYVADFLLPH